MTAIRFIWKVVQTTSATLLAIFALAIAVMVFDGFHDRIFKADLIVVPGNAVTRKGQPSARLQARLDKALELYRLGYGRIIFVSGGVEKGGMDESVVMANYLVRQGVPRHAIVKDNQGLTTANTAINVAGYMCDEGLRSVIVVTQYFHISRSKLALSQARIPKIGSAHAIFQEGRDFYSVPREVAAYLLYLIELPAKRNSCKA